jgi:hypothetical protein
VIRRERRAIAPPPIEIFFLLYPTMLASIS